MTTPKASNINSSFKFMKTITLISLIGSFGIIALCILLYTSQFNSLSHKAYFITSDETFVGVEKESRRLTSYEVKNHIRKFVGFMFSHDKKTYKNRVEAALKLCAKKDGTLMVADFNKAGVYSNLVKYDSRTYVKIDSIKVNMKQLPYSLKVYFVQYTYFDNNEIPTPIGMNWEFEETHRSDENTDGLMLQNFTYFEYSPKIEEAEAEKVLQEEITTDQIGQ